MSTDAFREVANLLYGGGADDLVAKMDAQAKREKRQAQVGLASNIVGLGAGVAGTAAALRDDRFKEGGKLSRKIYATGQKIPKPISSKAGKTGAALAGGALGLQVANIAGDAVANRVLARSASSKPKKARVHKASPDQSELHISTGALKRKVLTKAGNHVETKVKCGTKQGMIRLKSQVSKKADEFDVRWEGEISKVDSDKQQVFGWASIVEMNGEPVVDLQGDYISISEVEKSAYEYVHKSRKGGDMHLRDGDAPVHKSDMIESFVVTPEKKKALGLPEEMPVGWWVGYQINDPELWSKVKNGERTGFSIHGRGMRTPMGE